MKQELNEFGEALFKPDECLDLGQIKSLFYNFKQNKRKKESGISRPRKEKAESDEAKPEIEKTNTKVRKK